MPTPGGVQQRANPASVLRSLPRPAQGVCARVHAARGDAAACAGAAAAAAARQPWLSARHAQLYPLLN